MKFSWIGFKAIVEIYLSAVSKLFHRSFVHKYKMWHRLHNQQIRLRHIPLINHVSKWWKEEVRVLNLAEHQKECLEKSPNLESIFVFCFRLVKWKERDFGNQPVCMNSSSIRHHSFNNDYWGCTFVKVLGPTRSLMSIGPLHKSKVQCKSRPQ